MKTTNYIKSIALALATAFSVSLFVLADGDEPMRGGEKSIAGGVVEDASVTVAPGAYTSFSTVSGGMRYYLGVDTTAAQSEIYRVAVYDAPCYATIWQVGELYSYTGEILDDKNYQRTVKSVYLAEKYPSGDAFLAVGDNHGTWSDLELVSDSANATLWFTQKDDRATGRYIQGFLYFSYEQASTTIYRYLAYDPLYGFSRTFSTRPSASQRVSIWDRKKGNQVTAHFASSTYTFGLSYEASEDTTFEFRLQLELDGDRFRSQYDGAEFYAKEPEIIDDQATLASYGITPTLDWASSKGDLPNRYNSLFNGTELVYNDETRNVEVRPVVDRVMMTVDETVTRDDAAKKYTGTFTAIGPSPINIMDAEGNHLNHRDYLHIHATYGGKEFTDSVLVIRNVYYAESFRKLEGYCNPSDKTFPFSADAEQSQDFVDSLHYAAGNRLRTAEGKIVTPDDIGEEYDIDLTDGHLCYRDTFWTDETKTVVGHISLQDTLLVRLTLDDGVTNAIIGAPGSNANSWIRSMTVSNGTIRVTASAYPEGAASSAYRVATLRCDYTYRHSNILGDTARASQVIWIVQEPGNADGVIKFDHTKGVSGGYEVITGRQPAPEVVQTYYAIPEQSNPLQLHHDHWGYYRWHLYTGEYKDRDISWDWAWRTLPRNHEGSEFYVINSPETRFSRGYFDMYSRFDEGDATPVPAVAYKAGKTVTNYFDTLACDVSAYMDTTCTGDLGGLEFRGYKEPTLSYRQLFAMRPAVESADRMKAHRSATTETCLENYTYIAPAGRQFLLKPKYATDSLGPGGKTEMQYVYYFKPDASGNTDNNMGLDDGLNKDLGASYSRVGEVRKTSSTGPANDKIQLVTKADLDALPINGTMRVVMANPKKRNSGFIFGDNGSVGDRRAKTNFANTITTSDQLSEWNNLKNALNSNNSDYYLTITKVAEGTIQITSRHTHRYWVWDGPVWGHYETEQDIISTDGDDFGWRGYDYRDIKYDYFTPSDKDANCITGIDAGMFELSLPIGGGVYHYIDATASSVDIVSTRKRNSDQAWCFYRKVQITPTTEFLHQEGARWERKAPGGSWTSVDGMQPGGALLTSEDIALKNQMVQYRLRTEHFQIAQFTVVIRDPSSEGPSATAIIPEDVLDRDYELLANLSLEGIGTPSSSNVEMPYYPMDWNRTEFAYHYPVGSGEHQIPESKRVNDGAMPAKGEYIVTNKFVKTGHTTVESVSGAEHGYMLCYNLSERPLKFIESFYDKPACSEQDLVIVADFANPTSGKHPHVKAQMYGRRGNGAWEIIYTFITGEIPDNGKWHQLVLPLEWARIEDYDQFRCVGTLSGAEGDAYILFDRFRLMGKNRALTIFQKRTTCIEKDSIYLISRLDYQSARMTPGTIICYQYQKWDGTQWVPMAASSGSGPYTRLPANETDVYPGYYKTAMTANEAVTTAAFKSKSGNDYGFLVVPEANYNPTASGSAGGQSTARKTVIDAVATALGGGSRAAYYDEHLDIRSFEDVLISQSFNFGSYDNPKMKFYVNEGTNDDPYWVMYLINRVSIHDTQNGQFRIAMQNITDVLTQPNFNTEGCSGERIVNITQSVDLRVDDAAWTNQTRAEANAAGTLVPANNSYDLKIIIPAPAGAKEGTTGDGKFDLLRTFEFMRGYYEMTPEQQAAANTQFMAQYGCRIGEYEQAMDIFRDDNEANPNRAVLHWNEVTRESFRWNDAYSAEAADSAYNLLNRLILDDRLLEVGLSDCDMYIGSNQDLYFFVRPIAATGTYTAVSAYSSQDTIVETTICNHALWLEMHSTNVPQELRLGYDKKFGDAYAIPVIRASAAVANSELPVRISEITHDVFANTGITLGWDSTRVVETNDPAWNPATSSFRYTQDRILQSNTYAKYYKTGDTILFRPVDPAHVSALQDRTCACYDYDPRGTTYDIVHPREHGASGTNAVVKPASPLTDCNQWHKQAQTGGDIKTRQPGYQVANNFTLHAGYWYKFRTSFFTKPNAILGYGSSASAGTPLGYSYFILAVAPDTAIWTPSYDDRTNYWNDDNNWTAIVNGEPFHEAIARVPLEETNVIIGRPAIENHLPVVNNDSLGDVTKGDIDWGFKTATCRDILFRPLSQIYGQEYLNYRRAFTDVRFQEGTWRTFTPALKNIYSGDMYVPEDSAADMASYFAPLTFNSGSEFSSTHNRVWPYLFYQSFYNQTVRHAFQNTDKDGNPVEYRENSSAEWQQTNVLNESMAPGKVSAIIAWGPVGNEKDIIVRLPKQESVYHYVGLDGTVDPTEISLERTAFGAINHNLAFDKTSLGGNTYKDYTLTNQTPAKLFWFGNATMELIDVYQFCLDNADNLENEGGTSFVVYELIGESAYAVYVLNPSTVDRHNLFLAPMRAIGIMAREATTSLTVRLNTSALIPMPGSMTPVQNLNPAPARRMLTFEEPYNATLYISATGTAEGEKYKAYITLAENNNASDAFVGGEDAECVVSPNMADFTFHTPLAMYTVCENRSLMYDSRELVGRVPLGFSMLSDYSFDDRIILSFATEGKWNRPLYLHDALTGDSIMIMNGMRVAIAAPQSDELRYYINGGEHLASGEEQQGTATGIELVEDENTQPQTTNNNSQTTYVYDVLGRKVAVLGENDLLTRINLPTGVYIISRGDKTERIVIK